MQHQRVSLPGKVGTADSKLLSWSWRTSQAEQKESTRRERQQLYKQSLSCPGAKRIFTDGATTLPQTKLLVLLQSQGLLHNDFPSFWMALGLCVLQSFSCARTQKSVCFLHQKLEEQHLRREKFSLLGFAFCLFFFFSFSSCSCFNDVLLWKFPSVKILSRNGVFSLLHNSLWSCCIIYP